MKEKHCYIRVEKSCTIKGYNDYVMSRRRSHIRVRWGWRPPFSEFVAVTMRVCAAIRVIVCLAGKLKYAGLAYSSTHVVASVSFLNCNAMWTCNTRVQALKMEVVCSSEM